MVTSRRETFKHLDVCKSGLNPLGSAAVPDHCGAPRGGQGGLAVARQSGFAAPVDGGMPKT